MLHVGSNTKNLSKNKIFLDTMQVCKASYHQNETKKKAPYPMDINTSHPLKIALTSLLLSSTFLNASDGNTLNFQPLYSFATTSINYLDWSKTTQTSTGRTDFTFLELEGG